MKIYVIGGTNYDAEMGVAMLKKREIASRPISIAGSPDEYIERAQNPAALQERVYEKMIACFEREVNNPAQRTGIYRPY